jgi:hypothetical protein
MATQNLRTTNVADVDWVQIEAWVVEFDQKSEVGPLRECVEQDPSGNLCTILYLAELIEVDLKRQRGHKLNIESFLGIMALIPCLGWIPFPCIIDKSATLTREKRLSGGGLRAKPSPLHWDKDSSLNKVDTSQSRAGTC